MFSLLFKDLISDFYSLFGPRQANLILIAYACSKGSGEPAHPRSLARTFAARSYKQWIKRNFQTENQIPGPSEWLDMRSWNLSWRNARRYKFAWRGSFYMDTILWHSLYHCMLLRHCIVLIFVSTQSNVTIGPDQANLCLRAFRHDKF